ncbi:MAG: NAD(+) synthase [Candidatus Saccharicenans sp.]
MESEIKLTKDLGYIRIGAAVPQLRVTDIDYNLSSILDLIEEARKKGVQILSFPEMSLTGYTLGDLVQHQTLLEKVRKVLDLILAKTSSGSPLVILGMPLSVEQKIFNAAAVIKNGRLLGIIPKTFLPNYKEFYDPRWFASGGDTQAKFIEFNQDTIPFGTDLLFRIKNFPLALVGVEICEDLWVPLSPHEHQSLAGATLLFNLSASNEILGKADWRRTMVLSESGRCLAAYCYVSSTLGESSNDMIFGGQAIIAENGLLLGESKRLVKEPQLLIADVDIEKLAFDRRISGSFQDSARRASGFRIIETEIDDLPATELKRPLEAHPFVPADPSKRDERCQEIVSMQIAALAQKLTGAKIKHLVIGVSGGLDSTLALLIAVKTMDFLGYPRTNVQAFTLPGFGTSQRTKSNATKLCKALGVSFKEVNITRTCRSQLKDLNHSGRQDITFENVQARYRTAFLFNKANELEAIMLGTGDLTEVALGWSTFAGDHISHYHVNVSVPKTLVRFLIKWVADQEPVGSPVKNCLEDILMTPISPELLPPDKETIVQKTEDIIGPVELADFFLYPFIRFGIKPGKILFLADQVRRKGLFDRTYTLDELYHWFKSFLLRFFSNQFKRTCLPEGPKIGSVSLSPRSDWRMPSEAQPGLWLEDLEQMYQKLSLQGDKTSFNQKF